MAVQLYAESRADDLLCGRTARLVLKTPGSRLPTADTFLAISSTMGRSDWSVWKTVLGVKLQDSAFETLSGYTTTVVPPLTVVESTVECNVAESKALCHGTD